MAAIDAERFLDNLPVEIMTREESGVIAEECKPDQYKIIRGDVVIVSSEVDNELEAVEAEPVWVLS